jgi:pilus assembly protein TadC
MPKFQILVIRLIVGLVIAVVMSRFFFGEITAVSVGGLMIFLVGMAYVTEYLRNRNKKHGA